MEQLRLLAFSAIRHDLNPGQVLFREAEAAHSGYVVTFGALELATGEGSKRKVLVTCEPGSLVGEIALFVDTTRPATAAAVVATEVLELPRKLMTRMLTEFPRVAERLRMKIAERLSATISELGRVEAALTDIERRAAARRS